MMTKAQGRNLFGEQYPGVMGEGVVPLVPDMVRTIEEDNLLCSHCSKYGLLTLRGIVLKLYFTSLFMVCFNSSVLEGKL